MKIALILFLKMSGNNVTADAGKAKIICPPPPGGGHNTTGIDSGQEISSQTTPSLLLSLIGVLASLEKTIPLLWFQLGMWSIFEYVYMLLIWLTYLFSPYIPVLCC